MPPIPADAQYGDSKAIRIHDRIKYGLVRRMARKQGDDSVSEERCGNCRFWVYEKDWENDIGECRRFPPSPDLPQLFENLTRKELHGKFLEFTNWTHPSAEIDDWCGEWQPQGKPAASDTYLRLIDQLKAMGFNARARKLFIRDKCETLDDVTARTADHVRGLKNCGASTLSHIRGALAQHGLKLRGDQ